MLLFVFTCLWIFVLEDKVDLPQLAMPIVLADWGHMYLVGTTALIGTKHDDIGGSVRELLEMKGLILPKKL